MSRIPVVALLTFALLSLPADTHPVVKAWQPPPFCGLYIAGQIDGQAFAKWYCPVTLASTE